MLNIIKLFFFPIESYCCTLLHVFEFSMLECIF